MSRVGKKIRVAEGIYTRLDIKNEISYYINYRINFLKSKTGPNYSRWNQNCQMRKDSNSIPTRIKLESSITTE